MFRKFVLGLSIVFLTVATFVSALRAQENKNIILATTTSVQDTGLLDVLMQAFWQKTGYIVKAIAVGTGQALQMGRLGEADILWVHSPADEKQFVADGYGMNRTTFMHNDFLILGPENDPAKVLGVSSAVEAFKKIAAGKTLFVSRGDNSGTHKKEKMIWKEAGVSPIKDAYIEVGQGMAATVAIANEKKAYCLVDRSSYLSLKKSINLLIVFEGDPLLINYYSLILVNPDKFSKINVSGAKALFDFLLSGEARGIVESFGKDKFGQPLFFWDDK